MSGIEYTLTPASLKSHSSSLSVSISSYLRHNRLLAHAVITKQLLDCMTCGMQKVAKLVFDCTEAIEKQFSCNLLIYSHYVKSTDIVVSMLFQSH